MIYINREAWLALQQFSTPVVVLVTLGGVKIRGQVKQSKEAQPGEKGSYCTDRCYCAFCVW